MISESTTPTLPTVLFVTSNQDNVTHVETQLLRFRVKVVAFPKRFDVLLGPSLPEVVLALPKVLRSFPHIRILVTSEHVRNIVGDPKHHGVRRQDWQLLVILDVRQFQPRRCCLVGPEIETKVETETADLTHDSHSFPERKHV